MTWAVELSDVQAELRKRYVNTLVMENFDRLHVRLGLKTCSFTLREGRPSRNVVNKRGNSFFYPSGLRQAHVFV